MNTTSLQNGVGDGGIMLFGVRLTEGSRSSSSSLFRKSSSMNNLTLLDSPQDPAADVAAGYASDDFVHASGRSRERKRGTPWTEEEHRLFLIGLQQVGKGDWRGISRNFVKTRTPTQVASHAQKYFNRLNNHNGRRRRRTSLFDITSNVAASSNMEEDDQSPTCPLPAAPVSISPFKTYMELEASPLTLGLPTLGRHHQINPARSIPIPPSSKLASLKLNPSNIADPLPLSLRLPTGGVSNNPKSSSSSSFQGVPPDSLNSSRDGMISVA